MNIIINEELFYKFKKIRSENILTYIKLLTLGPKVKANIKEIAKNINTDYQAVRRTIRFLEDIKLIKYVDKHIIFNTHKGFINWLPDIQENIVIKNEIMEKTNILSDSIKILQYLNKTANKNIEPTECNLKPIEEKLKQHDYNTLIKVIDNKIEERKKNSLINKTLIPQLLFGSKFDIYLKQSKI